VVAALGCSGGRRCRGVLLYVGARDFRSQTKRTEPATQIAENREDNAVARDSYEPPQRRGLCR